MHVLQHRKSSWCCDLNMKGSAGSQNEPVTSLPMIVEDGGGGIFSLESQKPIKTTINFMQLH